MTWSFCYEFDGGGNFATVNGQRWSTTASGTLTTTAYAGKTTSGRTAYLITGMTGVRTYTNAGTGQASTANILGVGGPNTQQAVAYYSEQFDYLGQAGQEADISNNLFYPTYPYFDAWGVSVVTDTFIGNEDQNNLTVNAFRLWVDPGSYSFNEWVTDFTAGYWYFTYSGNSIFTPLPPPPSLPPALRRSALRRILPLAPRCSSSSATTSTTSPPTLPASRTRTAR